MLSIFKYLVENAKRPIGDKLKMGFQNKVAQPLKMTTSSLSDLAQSMRVGLSKPIGSFGDRMYSLQTSNLRPAQMLNTDYNRRLDQFQMDQMKNYSNNPTSSLTPEAKLRQDALIGAEYNTRIKPNIFQNWGNALSQSPRVINIKPDQLKRYNPADFGFNQLTIPYYVSPSNDNNDRIIDI